MSVNVILSLKVSGYRADRIEAIKAAVTVLFAREDLATDMSPLIEGLENGQPTLLSQSNPDYPVIISKSYGWLPEMQAAFEAAVTQANGGPCEVAFNGDQPDDSDEDEEEPEEDE